MVTNASLKQNTGRIHSVETFGTVDGPGIRLVVFVQGCPLRCAFCHNPDTWEFSGGEQMTVDEILALYTRNESYYKNGGGITLSGGEPLSQPEFALELFRAAHNRKEGRIHTCLDTSGGLWNEAKIEVIEELLDECDLVMLDIKHSDPAGYKKLCGRDQEHVMKFGDLLAKKDVPTLIRHVVVPGITDLDEEVEGIGRIIAHWPNVKGLQLLPYHTMGVDKYSELGLHYRLEGVEQMDKNQIAPLRRLALKARAHEVHKIESNS